VQRRLADLSGPQPQLLPEAAADVLRVHQRPAGEEVHQIQPATVPSIGVVFERKHQLSPRYRRQPGAEVAPATQPIPTPAKPHHALRRVGRRQTSHVDLPDGFDTSLEPTTRDPTNSTRR
jgi:hypothetical protein